LLALVAGEFPGLASLGEWLATDVRDVQWWARKARQRAWLRRVLAYGAALLPYQKADDVRQAMDKLRAEGLEFALGDQAPEVDAENARLMAAARERQAAARSAPRRPKSKPKRRHSRIRRI